ncbi:uncharacterized protein LOC128986019 isoform X1 [Macrosteles quadrilineatus]|uniref:uncharacterized protein LOC128986019 isoform X1 n=2 Tax=Macrosteles quadrilineatus TaxID=74068 RepID=UPI0023E1378F|nr:uncharacterized protein LOC128986019 isoform X1 [Macrosteles quadrilineatus]
MAFITSTALLCTTISAVTIQALSESTGTRKGNKKPVTNGSIDSPAKFVRQTPVQQQRTKRTTIKKSLVSKCNIFKIRDFVLYPIKAVVPVTDVYSIKNHNINSTRNPSVSNRKQSVKRITKSSSTPKQGKSTRTTSLNNSKGKRKSTKRLKASKNLSSKTNSKTKNRPTKKKSVQKTSSLKLRETKTTVVSQKPSLPSSPVHDIKMVLSADQFIFKPTIPITETNYPLENTEKLDLYAQDSAIEKVLSYSFTDPVIKNYIKFPSVSKIIEETISDKTKQILGNWRQKMIDDLGEDGFYNHSEALKVRGTEFHMAVRNAVLGKTTENCSEVTQNSLKSLSWMLEHISNPMAVESTIAHPKLGYRGVADCIAMFRNIPVMIDWKLSDKPKRDLKDTYDAPVQITAYIGALNHDPNYKWGVNHGLVAVAYANGDPCDVFLLAPKHCQIYWRHWLMRFDKFKDSDFGKRCFLRAENWIKNNLRYERLRQNRLQAQSRRRYYPHTSGQTTYGQPLQSRTPYRTSVGYRESRTDIERSNQYPRPNYYRGANEPVGPSLYPKPNDYPNPKEFTKLNEQAKPNEYPRPDSDYPRTSYNPGPHVYQKPNRYPRPSYNPGPNEYPNPNQFPRPNHPRPSYNPGPKKYPTLNQYTSQNSWNRANPNHFRTIIE